MANLTGKRALSIFIVLCMTYHAYCQVTCTQAGRFAFPNDTTCKNYTYCVANGTSFIAYNYVCPTTSVFNPNTAQCTASTNYVCNVTTTTTTNSVCVADGYIANPNVTDCSSYIECVNITGTFIETVYTCPTNTSFNPNTTLCETTYTCTSTFTCSAAGRFANTADTTCQTYYMCVLQTDGTYVQFEYTCPSTSVFSPTSRLCTTSYVCT